MPEQVVVIATLLAAIGAGIIGGVFYAFSTFVMQALTRIDPAAGVAAMQRINVVVINPKFLGVFLGTAAMSFVAMAGAILREQPGGRFVLAGALLYLVGTFGVTMAFNVPLNNRLAAMTVDDPQAPAKWADYAVRWTRWNHVRTAAAIAAMVCQILALRHPL